MTDRATTIEQVKAAERAWMLGSIDDVATELGWTAAEYETYQETGLIPAVEVDAIIETGGEKHIVEFKTEETRTPAPPTPVISNVLAGVNWTPEMIAKLSPEQRKAMGFVPESTPEVQPTEILRDEPELMADQVISLREEDLTKEQRQSLRQGDGLRMAKTVHINPQAGKEMVLDHAVAPKAKKRAPRKPKADGMAGKRKESRAIIERKKLEPGTQVSVSWGVDDKDGHRTVTHTGTVKEVDTDFLTIEPCTTPNGHLRLALTSPSAIGRIINLDSPEEPTEYRPDRWWLAPHHKRWRHEMAKDGSGLFEIRSETTRELAPEPNTFARPQYRDALERAHKLNRQEHDKYMSMPERPTEDR